MNPSNDFVQYLDNATPFSPDQRDHMDTTSLVHCYFLFFGLNITDIFLVVVLYMY